MNIDKLEEFQAQIMLQMQGHFAVTEEVISKNYPHLLEQYKKLFADFVAGKATLMQLQKFVSENISQQANKDFQTRMDLNKK